MKHNLMDLPCGVLVCLFREWLGMENTARLDTAMSSREGREKLLEVLRCGEVCYQGSNYEVHPFDVCVGEMNASQVKWAGLRGISLLGLVIKSDVTPEILLSVTRNSPGLKFLCLDGVVGLSAAHMSEIGHSCSHVNKLRFVNFLDTDTDAIMAEAARHMHSLERVRLKNCETTGDASLIALSQHCPGINYVFIGRDKVGCDVSDEGIISLAQGCRLIEKMTLYDINSFTGDALRAIADNCNSIKRLAVYLNGYKPLPISDDDLIYFSQRCTTITELEFHVSHLITDAAATKMLQYLCNVTVINLHQVTLLTDSTVNAVARYLPNLKISWFMMNENITDASITKVAESCRKLKSINLSDCIQISDASMIKIAEFCTELTDLCVSSCSRISDATLNKLAEFCPLLENLNCRKCPLVTEEARTRLKERLPTLKIIK